MSNHIPVYLPGGRTPLHFAAERGYDDVALELLQRGAKIDAKDNDGTHLNPCKVQPLTDT